MNIIKTTSQKSADPWVDVVLCKRGDVVLKGGVESSYISYNIDMGELTLTASFIYDGAVIIGLPFARYCVQVDRVHMVVYLYDTYSDLIPYLIPVGVFREFLASTLKKVLRDKDIPGFVAERLKVYVSGLERFSESEYLSGQVSREMWANLKVYSDEIAKKICDVTGGDLSIEDLKIRAMAEVGLLQPSSPNFDSKAKKILEIMGIKPATEVGFCIEEV
ncbi:MAG TPA: hypothetical protein VN420_03505 [Candidatus Fimivivens sp.]|nr:hypothetical protein [Candidatus Fimivivens sp.]